MAGWVTILGSVLVILSVFAQIGSLDSLDTRRGIEELLANPPLDALDLEVTSVLDVVRLLATVTGALAAATAILGWQVMQRSRSARLALTVLAVPLFLLGFVTGGFATSLVAAAAVILWLQPSRAWVNGDPVPERYLRPPSEARRDRDAGDADDRPSGAGWPPPLPPQDAPTDGPAQGRPDGPAPYTGFGQQPGQEPGQQPGQEPGQFPGPQGGAWPQQLPPYAAGDRAPRGPAPQPLRAGLVITWVTCAMVLLGLGLSVVAMAIDPSLVDDEIQRAMDEQPAMAAEVTVEQVRIALFVVLGGFALWALLAAGLAVLAWVGRSWAWILLCISAGLAAGLFLAVTVLGGLVAVVALAASSGTLALLIRPEVREWYRR
jgi:hypothetical protein